MKMQDLTAIRSKRVALPNEIRPATLLIERGKIKSIEDYDCPTPRGVVDAGDQVVMPGLVDSHVHVNEPGRTEWEGFKTATKAAAAGGITTIADMPLNSQPVTTTVPALEEKLAAAAGKLWVDCAFWGGVVPGNAGQLSEMSARGVVGFKCFLIHSGIDDFPNVEAAHLHEAMPILTRHELPLLVHAEMDCHGSTQHWHDNRLYHDFLASRPHEWEDDAIAMMIELCRAHKTKVHIVHLSSAHALPAIAQAKKEGLPLTVETCPHYLIFAAEDIPDGDTRFKCAPPIREKENRERLWAGVADGTIDMIVSDHSPCTPALKLMDEGDLKNAWGGISSLQFRLPAIWTEAQKRGYAISDLIGWMCRKPADFIGFADRKGLFAPGYDADIVVWSPERSFAVEPDLIEHRHKVTPYQGRNLLGQVEMTIVGGQLVFERGKLADSPAGQMLSGGKVVETSK